MERRNFLKSAVVAIAGAAIPVSALQFVNPKKVFAANPNLHWVFLVDTAKCVGCGMCVKACKLENGIPYDANVTRTWVERYVITKDGVTHADSPKGARDGFITQKIDEGADGLREIAPEDITKSYFVPKLCNQCDNPPCVQVCPVGATYKTADGVVLVDRKWCIGCGYCIMGCPYGVRFFHPVYHVADKCNFCYHRISQGMKTACVDACPFEARRIGNLKDLDDPVTKIIMTERIGVLKDEYGTKPQAYYIGLSKEVR
jgi:Fe-S-cluster-containing dehydrogenase component